MYSWFRYLDATGKFNETHCKVIFKKILEAINAIHKKGIYHLDIKLQNILLDENFQPKITDFVLSIQKEESKDCFLKLNKEVIGTKEYMAPQILAYKKFNTIKADIFSLGVTIFTLSARVNRFGKASGKDFFYKHIKENTENSIKEYWNKIKEYNINLSDSLQKLYIKMVSFDEDKRPSIDEILKDEWFSEIENLIFHFFLRIK